MNCAVRTKTVRAAAPRSFRLIWTCCAQCIWFVFCLFNNYNSYRLFFKIKINCVAIWPSALHVLLKGWLINMEDDLGVSSLWFTVPPNTPITQMPADIVTHHNSMNISAYVWRITKAWLYLFDPCSSTHSLLDKRLGGFPSCQPQELKDPPDECHAE